MEAWQLALGLLAFSQRKGAILTDVLNKQQRSFCMSNIRGRNTQPELSIRKVLWSKGYRYRLQNKLPGKPDLVFVTAKVAVFVDGCFWHRCPEHYTSPKTRSDFWEKKIAGNVERDKKVCTKLKELGWMVLRFWEHEIENDVASCAEKVIHAIRKNKESNFIQPSR